VHGIAFQQNTRDEVRYINGDGEIAGALMAEPGMKQQNYIMQSYGFEPGIAKREGDPNRFVEEMTPTLRAGMGDNQTAVAFGWQNSAQQGMSVDEIIPTLDTSKTPAVAINTNNMAVRRLTPIECERLQGFPNHYTDIKPKGKPTPDGPRYKALGNSMAVPVMKWIGERINQYERGEL
jgi:DNA (cytosine-5)-methyltransferase 1